MSPRSQKNRLFDGFDAFETWVKTPNAPLQFRFRRAEVRLDKAGAVE